jgi:two-component system phosphate regulon response regulator PhoB
MDNTDKNYDSTSTPSLMQGSTHSAQRRIVIIERDESALGGLRHQLTAAGFSVTTVDYNSDTQQAIRMEDPHVVMLDWDLPGVVTMNLVRQLRSQNGKSSPRLIALSALTSEHHVVSGLDMGVDDYVVKPFSVPEVMARVRAMLRSTCRNEPESGTCFALLKLRLDTSEGYVSIDGQPVSLRNLEYRLLEFLLRHPEHAFQRATLLYRVWSRDTTANERAVDVTVQRIRKALRPHGYDRYLQTVRGSGYRLSARLPAG